MFANWAAADPAGQAPRGYVEKEDPKRPYLPLRAISCECKSWQLLALGAKDDWDVARPFKAVREICDLLSFEGAVAGMRNDPLWRLLRPAYGRCRLSRRSLSGGNRDDTQDPK